MSATDPLSTRGAQMKIYNTLMQELDAAGANYSKDVNEVDLADPEDVKVTVADKDGAVTIHLGSSNFLERYKIYVGHVQEWRQQFPKLNSVDLRYERQVILNPDMRGAQGNVPETAPVKLPVPEKSAPAPFTKHKPSARHR